MEEDGVQITSLQLRGASWLLLMVSLFNFFCAQRPCSGNAVTAFPAAMLQKIHNEGMAKAY